MTSSEIDERADTSPRQNSAAYRAITRVRQQATLLLELEDTVRSSTLLWSARIFEEGVKDEGESLMTVNQASVLAGVSPAVIRRALASGSLLNVGRRYRPRVRKGDLWVWSPPRGLQGPQSSDAADASKSDGTQLDFLAAL